MNATAADFQTVCAATAPAGPATAAWGTDRPIGLYDSGVGGLSVLNEVRRLLPGENLLYLADTAHLPYGAKPAQAIVARACAIGDFFAARQVKAIGVACNTATAAAIEVLRARHPALAVVGIEPAVKPAAALTRSGVIGVLATSGTLASARFAELLRREAPHARVLLQACPDWVERVERGDLDSPAARRSVRAAVAPLLAQGADTLVLGCTHFPFLAPLLREMAGPDVAILETGAAFARQLQRRLHELDALRAPQPAGTLQWLTTGDAAALQSCIDRLLGWPAQCAAVPELS
ncbi:glutamate racemase [Orrella sp. JC864]|uniref:glutamate racemase n=1 Tax=Orrella sp. JC864 TaxID=3120298 RepID=UPI0030080283